MKITKIEICDFRGFPGPAVYDFNFDGGSNLLIYGENGSGKSSLFRAVQAWPFGGLRPLNRVPASQTALQVGCLDYRSLLDTNFSQKGDKVNLFDIAVKHLVGNLEVPVGGGGSERIGDLWERARRSFGRALWCWGCWPLSCFSLS